jgi:hypothetical protein
MRYAALIALVLVGSVQAAAAQTVTLQLTPVTTLCSPGAGGGMPNCFDTGLVTLGPLTVGKYSRTINIDDANVNQHFYGGPTPNCGPVEEKIILAIQPPIASFGGYLQLEAVSFGIPGTTEPCASLGTVGAGTAPSGAVAITSADFAAFRGLAWGHPSLVAKDLVVLRLP